MDMRGAAVVPAGIDGVENDPASAIGQLRAANNVLPVASTLWLSLWPETPNRAPSRHNARCRPAHHESRCTPRPRSRAAARSAAPRACPRRCRIARVSGRNRTALPLACGVRMQAGSASAATGAASARPGNRPAALADHPRKPRRVDELTPSLLSVGREIVIGKQVGR